MIEVSIEPTHLVANQPNDVVLTLRNAGADACTDIVFKLTMPPHFVLLRGPDRVEQSRLNPAQKLEHRIVVSPGSCGNWMLRSTNFSYVTSRGITQRVSDFQFPVVVEEAAAKTPPNPRTGNSPTVEPGLTPRSSGDPVSVTADMTPDELHKYLAGKLQEFFDMDSLVILCDSMSIDHENLEHRTKRIFVINLIKYCEQRTLLRKLLDEAREARPGQL